MEMGNDAETPASNGACLPLDSAPCETAVTSVSSSGDSGEVSPALLEPKRFQDWLSLFHAFDGWA